MAYWEGVSLLPSKTVSMPSFTLRGDCRSVASKANLESSVSFQPVLSQCRHLPFGNLGLLSLPFVSVAMYRLWLPSIQPTWGLDFWELEVDLNSVGVHVLHDRITEKGLKWHMCSICIQHTYQCFCVCHKSQIALSVQRAVWVALLPLQRWDKPQNTCMLPKPAGQVLMKCPSPGAAQDRA